MNKQRLIIRISRDGIMLSSTEENSVKFERYPLNSGIALVSAEFFMNVAEEIKNGL